ncbi:molybdopterin-guanine dinucleotide biosynthesis protein A [Flagellimonas taeanensis]|uniref:Probable molybdenum cofactor guanylyltransferase n=1 Tax=Flagellimonas taeanensis TaxID=1005926 RepID=A0A1M6ZVT0_9FLAO|nr:NTP transferase domain-containing protein [Allomuricauda taeanensis]SFC28171.1 molybdopterin-guanine dinucleotide biosynthesis protein A [Allomuricauda taeanensis]SHL34572.1 molybdenum cofactor guanylyltransferase [Allomuricauda taeanensis]
MENKAPIVYGLVLAGGKSTRMGADKGWLTYHKVPQQEYLYTLLGEVCDQVYLSVRKEQQQDIPEGFKTIVDNDEHRGPFNGILSAHTQHPDVAWLVLACDLPLIDKNALRQLMDNRDPNKKATSFGTCETGLPEPLVAIWEPTGLEEAKAYLKTAESSCPRKFLIHSDIALVHPEKDEVLYNANSLEEYEFAKSKLQTHGS